MNQEENIEFLMSYDFVILTLINYLSIFYKLIIDILKNFIYLFTRKLRKMPDDIPSISIDDIPSLSTDERIEIANKRLKIFDTVIGKNRSLPQSKKEVFNSWKCNKEDKKYKSIIKDWLS